MTRRCGASGAGMAASHLLPQTAGYASNVSEVRRFARYHKYTVGADLRTQAMRMMRGVNRACFDTAQQAQHVQALVWLVDDYKLTLQLTMEVGAFSNAAKGQAHFQQFYEKLMSGHPEEAANLAANIGKQCGGWQQKTASRLRAQVGQPGAQGVSQDVQPAAPGSKPAATPQAHPASLSACTASASEPFTLTRGGVGNEATP